MKAQTVHITDKMLRDAVIAQLDFERKSIPRESAWLRRMACDAFRICGRLRAEGRG